MKASTNAEGGGWKYYQSLNQAGNGYPATIEAGGVLTFSSVRDISTAKGAGSIQAVREVYLQRISYIGLRWIALVKRSGSSNTVIDLIGDTTITGEGPWSVTGTDTSAAGEKMSKSAMRC